VSAHQLLGAAGRPRSPATMPGHHVGRVPPSKGRRYPADPSTVDEIVAVMRQAGGGRHGRRMRGLIVVLWRAGVRIHEALTLTETDLNERRGSLLIRHGKGDRRREVEMDPWAWSVLADWTTDRTVLPPGRLFCVIDAPTRGRAWSATGTTLVVWRHLAPRHVVQRRRLQAHVARATVARALARSITQQAVTEPVGMTGSATQTESNQLTFVNGAEVSTVSRPMQALASWNFVMVTDFPLTLNL
jgi:integrase